MEHILHGLIPGFGAPGFGAMLPLPCAAVFPHILQRVWPAAVWQGLGVILCMVFMAAWRIRDLAHVARQRELRLAVRHRTDQLERGQLMDGARNQILEMLVTNAPLDLVLDAIARLASDQMPEAICVLLLKQDRADSHGDFRIGAAPGVPNDWQDAMTEPGGVPFEVWRQPCEYAAIREAPAWRAFVKHLCGEPGSSILTPILPETLRSLPIGEPDAPLGAILLAYSEPARKEPWETALHPVVRLAQIAINHRRYCDELAFRANHDSLTGLPNRNLLEEGLEGAIAKTKAEGQLLALLYVDIDEFKQINDRFGHRAGDALLSEIAVRITAALRPGDMVARLGGDEFNVLLRNIGSVAAAGEMASALVEAIRQPVSIKGHEFTVTASVGIAICPDDAQSAADLQREADAAMYYAKSLGKNRTQTFSDNATTLDSVRMERDLRRALEEGWFDVFYQPKFTAGNRLAGLEALIRLNHPSHGQILPGNFIPVAESSGLIVEIGAWVLAEVCRQIADWRSRNLSPVVVAVNVSTVQISRSDFARSVETCMAKYAIAAECLEIEVTESMVINRDSEEHRQMQLLRKLGVCISIDDFGTGFSSLSYLNRLQVDAVKLDRSFAQSIDTDGGAQHVVRAMVAVARELGLDVIAEGVETEAQREQLVAAGCPVMQGYLFARPGPPETIEPLLCAEPSGADLNRLYGAIEAKAFSTPRGVS